MGSGLDTAGSIMTFEPGRMIKKKGGAETKFEGMVQMALYDNRIVYDGCTCCCGCQGEISFSDIGDLETNSSSVIIQTMDGYQIIIGPLLPQQLNQVYIISQSL